jgi:hypothetical protein
MPGINKLPQHGTALRRFVSLIIFLLASSGAQAQCCTFTLSLHDSYGGGWNGAYLEVYVNQFLAGTYSASNYASTDTFPACTGDTLKLVYTPGSYENENSYQLFDPAWNTLYSAGPNPLTGNVLLSIANCNTLVIPGSHPCTAIPIDTGQCIIADNSGSTSTSPDPGCANYQGGAVWFTTIVPPSGNLGFETDSGTLGDTGLGIWTADSLCTNLSYVACDDDAGAGTFSHVDLYDLTPGTTLYIQVFGYGGGTGSFRLCCSAYEKVVLDSSELPIVIINTQHQTIVQDHKINCTMDMKYNGPGSITHVTDNANVYSGNIGIEVRGATSAGFPQRPYGLETRIDSLTNNNVSLLNMTAENDWVLLSNFNDRSLIRNALALRLFRDMGNYSPRTSLCEVLVDSIYKGIYVFAEKIKRDSGRVHIAKLTESDTTGDGLTGGYILQQNYWDAGNSFQSNYSPIDHPGFDVHFLYEYPAAADILPVQKAYIASFVDSLEDALYSAGFADTATGYRKYMDVKSFIDYFIVNEVSRNMDGFKKSVFFHKDKNSKGGKLKAGPVWDFDWAWKNLTICDICNTTDGSGWAYQVNDCPTDNYSAGWYVRLLQDSSFANELRCTYEQYRSTILDTTYLFAYIDSVHSLVAHAQDRHFKKWHLLGAPGFAPEAGLSATTYGAELDTLKSWISARLQWMDANLPGHCIPTTAPDLAQPNAAGLLRYYPNPSSGIFHFEGTIKGDTPLDMDITNVSGQVIDHFKLKAGQQKFDYQLERKGVYFFSIRNKSKCAQYGKLIVL